MDLEYFADTDAVVGSRGDHQGAPLNIGHGGLDFTHRLFHAGALLFEYVSQLVNAILSGLADDRLGEIRAGHVHLNAGDSLAKHSADRTERITLADGFTARLAGGDYFGGLCVDQPIGDGYHRLVLVLTGGDPTEHSADDTASLDTPLFVVTSKDNDVTGEHCVRSGNAAHTRAAALLHAVARIEILFLDQSVHLRALDDD